MSDKSEPTVEEVASCALLAEVAGMSERNAVRTLARRLSEATRERAHEIREISEMLDAAGVTQCGDETIRARVKRLIAGEYDGDEYLPVYSPEDPPSQEKRDEVRRRVADILR